MKWLDGARARLRLLFARRAAESRMNQEFRLHIELETEHLIAKGVAPDEARRRAIVAFGGVEQHKEALRDGRGLAWLGGFAFDLTLGARLLARYPGLTTVGVLGMAVGITIAAVALTIGASLMDPALPFDEGERIVAIGQWDVRTNTEEPRVLHELAAWRTALRSVEDVGAFRLVTRSLIAPGALPEAVPVAEISASAFRVTRVSPSIGRPLLAEDQRAGAPDVVVIGDDIWRRRFGADPAILGREIQLGSKRHAIVGVMPPGYRFPLAHSVWIPLRVAASYEPLTGPSVTVFARLAPGATLAATQAEVTTIGQRMSAESPTTHRYLRARVLPYTHAFTDMGDPDNAQAMRLIVLTIILLLAVVCVNVAILVYARTATRQGEIAVRSALGASRRRIVAQLFIEALVLAGAAALVAIGLLSVTFRQLDRAMQQLAVGFPFWLEFTLSTETVVFIVALTILSAAIVGIVPALKATARRVQSGLQGVSAGSGSRMQMGTMWTLLIVAQVAITVAVLPQTIYQAWNMLRFRVASSSVAMREFLTTDLERERPTEAAPSIEADRQFRKDYASALAELERRLEAEPAVSNVTFSLAPPGGEMAAVVEVEGAAIVPGEIQYNIVEGVRHGHLARFNRVSIDFFEAFDVPLLMGRSFQPSDVGPAAAGVLVNRTFMARLFGGANPLGRRIRYVGRSREAGEGNVVLDRWYEIVGVVSDVPPLRRRESNAAGGDPPVPRIYHAVPAEDVYPVALAVRVRGSEPSQFSDRLRQIAARLDPALQLRNLFTAEEASRREQGLTRLIGVTLVTVVGSVVALSAAGIYALMSFTVARRRKEIGIRTALGANQTRILAAVFSRALGQLAAGALVGMSSAMAFEGLVEGEMYRGYGAVIVPLVAVFMTAVGLLASVGPARRGLRMHPTDALREE